MSPSSISYHWSTGPCKALCKVMQHYFGAYKKRELFEKGLILLEDLEGNENSRVYADNPRKLMRTPEVSNILTCSQMIIHAPMVKKVSSRSLDVFRLDNPENDPTEWHTWVTIKLGGWKRQKWRVAH